MNVHFNGYDCVVVFAPYFNGNTAIQLFGKEGTEYEGELVTVASVNGEMEVPEDIVGIKTWSENRGIVKALIDANVIEDQIQFTEPTGFVEIQYYKLTNASLEEIKDLKEAK